MIEYRFVQECENPPEQVSFKRFVFTEPVSCKEDEELQIEIDWETGTAEAKAVKREYVDPRIERLDRLEYSLTCLINNCRGNGSFDYRSNRLLEKWDFEIKKLDYILTG